MGSLGPVEYLCRSQPNADASIQFSKSSNFVPLCLYFSNSPNVIGVGKDLSNSYDIQETVVTLIPLLRKILLWKKDLLDAKKHSTVAFKLNILTKLDNEEVEGSAMGIENHSSKEVIKGHENKTPGLKIWVEIKQNFERT